MIYGIWTYLGLISIKITKYDGDDDSSGDGGFAFIDQIWRQHQEE